MDGRRDTAARLCEEVYQDASKAGIAPVAREAWCLGYVARILTENSDLSDENTPEDDVAIFEAYLEQDAEQKAGQIDGVALAAQIHGWVRQGNWSRARGVLAACREALGGEVPIGGEYAVLLLHRAAELLAEDDTVMWAAEMAQKLVQERLEQTHRRQAGAACGD